MPQAETSGQAPRRVQLDWTPAFYWLRLGWRDLWVHPGPSLLYGAFVFLVSWVIIASLFSLQMSAYLFPALAGFFVVGPVLALGLYEKSRRVEAGDAVSLSSMFLVRAQSTTQIMFAGVLLCMLVLLWMRAAVILYALFFGLHPFSGLADMLPFLLGTLEGQALFVVGTLVGGLFAAFAFSISVFAIPMLYDQRVDAFTAMAVSMSTVWRNLGVMLPWGAVVVFLGAISILSGLALLILVFPLLGHATWHAYREICEPPSPS